MMCLPSVAIVCMRVFLTQDRVPRKQGIVLVHLCARSRCTGEVFTEHLLWTQPSLCACICKAALLNSQEERELGRMEEMPADTAGAPGPVHSLHTPLEPRNRGCRPCLPRPAETLSLQG